MQKGDWIGLVIVGGMLTAIGLFLLLAKQVPQVTYAPVEITGTSVSATAVAGEPTVHLSAEVKQPSFIAIHQALGDAPGPVIGHSPLIAVGTHENLTVETTEALQTGTDYFVLMFADDGDGVFEAGVDLPIMSGGQVVKQRLSL